MPKKSSKSKTKRKTLHQKYKIIRKVKEHKKKKAKELKKLGGKVKPPKDPGIPAAWPFKEQLLKEIEMAKLKEVRGHQLHTLGMPCVVCTAVNVNSAELRLPQQEEAKLKRKEAQKERRVRTYRLRTALRV